MAVEQFLDIQQILLDRDKGAGDEVNIIFRPEENILLVLFGKILLLDVLARESHALAVGHFTAADNFGFNPLAVGTEYLEGQKAVVDQDRIARIHFLGQILIADGNDRFIPFHLFGCEGELAAFLQIDLSVLEGADAEFRTLGVQHDGNRQMELFTDLLDRIDSLQMLLMVSV